MYYSTAGLFSSVKKIMPVVKLTDWETRRAAKLRGAVRGSGGERM